MRSYFGPQQWWPAQTPFEVAVGAILTQNTSWGNASRAIDALKSRRLLDPPKIAAIPVRRLASVIRSCGYFNQKARRLKQFVRFLLKHYDGKMSSMRRGRVETLRTQLLGLWGIGPETADSILLYALEKPRFVVDAYTRRILARHSLIPWEAAYQEIQDLFEGRLPRRTALFNDYHAQFVALGKHFCHRQFPKCGKCPIRKVGRLRLEPGVLSR